MLQLVKHNSCRHLFYSFVFVFKNRQVSLPDALLWVGEIDIKMQ
jgi:hypothetical protein